MKIKPFLKDRIVLSVLGYFGFRPGSIRQAEIVPGEYYDNFGNVCKAVPLTATGQKERESLSGSYMERLTATQLQSATCQSHIEQILSGCDQCPFYERLPCPLNLSLPDGTKICHSHRFVIIRKAE